MSSTDFLKRYGKKIIKHDSGCWLWVGATSNRGYGVIRKDKRLIFAHKLSYQYANGEMKKGLVTDHLCRVKSCVNPKHLEAVTQLINVRRGNVSVKKSHCYRGHALKDPNLYHFKDGNRTCKTCCAIRSKINWAKKSKLLKLQKS